MYFVLFLSCSFPGKQAVRNEQLVMAHLICVVLFTDFCNDNCFPRFKALTLARPISHLLKKI